MISIFRPQFSPRSGPARGGTLVTIVGDNLGKHVADIDNGVTVANGKCAVEDNPYEPSIQSVESTCRMFCVRVCTCMYYVGICV